MANKTLCLNVRTVYHTRQKTSPMRLVAYRNINLFAAKEIICWRLNCLEETLRASLHSMWSAWMYFAVDQIHPFNAQQPDPWESKFYCIHARSVILLFDDTWCIQYAGRILHCGIWRKTDGNVISWLGTPFRCDHEAMALNLTTHLPSTFGTFLLTLGGSTWKETRSKDNDVVAGHFEDWANHMESSGNLQGHAWNHSFDRWRHE